MTIFFILIIHSNLFVNLNVIIEKLIMKYILILFVASVMLSACIEKEINPQDIVGKWTSTGLNQKLERDGISWSPWTKIGQVDNNQFFEFRSDRTFNYAPRSSFDSCFYGDKYTSTIAKSVILIGFTDFRKPSKFDCGLIDLAYPFSWIIYNVANDTLISGTSRSRIKYIKMK